MEAKEFLSRAWNIETQVQSRLEQIERLRSLACRVTAGFGGAGGPRSRNVTAMQDTIVRITEAEEKLNLKINELVTAKLGVMEVIDQVQDRTLQLLLEKRYVLFHTWEEVATGLGYTRRWTLKKHEDALEAVQRILDEGGDDMICTRTTQEFIYLINDFYRAYTEKYKEKNIHI